MVSQVFLEGPPPHPGYAPGRITQDLLDAPGGPREERVSFICQVCGEPGAARKALLLCSRCKTPTHADCWEYAGRCPTYGCSGITPLSPSTSEALEALSGGPATGTDGVQAGAALVIDEQTPAPEEWRRAQGLDLAHLFGYWGRRLGPAEFADAAIFFLILPLLLPMILLLVAVAAGPLITAALGRLAIVFPAQLERGVNSARGALAGPLVRDLSEGPAELPSGVLDGVIAGTVGFLLASLLKGAVPGLDARLP